MWPGRLCRCTFLSFLFSDNHAPLFRFPKMQTENETQQTPSPPPALKLGTDYDSDSYLDDLHSAASMSDDFFSDDGLFSRTGGSPFAFRDDQNLQNLNQAYSNLSIDDFVDLAQGFGDKNSSRDTSRMTFFPEKNSQDLDTLPSLNSSTLEKQCSPNKKHEIERKNDFPLFDSAFEDQDSNLSIENINDFVQGFGDTNTSQDVTKIEFSPAKKLSQDQDTSLNSRPEKQPQKKQPQIGDEASHENFFPTLHCIFQDQLLNSILGDDAEFQDFDDFLNCDVQSDTDLRLADDFEVQADDFQLQADDLQVQAGQTQDQKEKLSNSTTKISAPTPMSIINEFPQQFATAPQPQKRKPCEHMSDEPKPRKRKSSKPKSSKRKSDKLSLGEKRKTKWRRGTNDAKMKRGVHQVRIFRRKIRVVAEEQGMNERALRRYVHISMDPRKQNSGYYIPIQRGEKVPKCLRSIVKSTC